MEKLENEQSRMDEMIRLNECPEKDQEGNCLVDGVFSDSDPIGGG